MFRVKLPSSTLHWVTSPLQHGWTLQTGEKKLKKGPEILKVFSHPPFEWWWGEKLRFVVIVFTPNGTFVGIQNDTSVMQLCQESASKMAAAFSFLTTYKISCTISVQKLKSQEMLFYDLYYYVGDKLYPVPLLVENYLSSGTAVNTKTDKTKWKLTRRLFLA